MMSAVDQLKRTNDVNPNTGSSVSVRNCFVFASTDEKKTLKITNTNTLAFSLTSQVTV